MKKPKPQKRRFDLKLLPNIWFDSLTHTYNVVGTERFLEGVTTLMKHQHLSADYGGINADVLAHAAARGTAVHKMLEEYDNTGQTITRRDISWENEDGTVGTEVLDFSKELASYSELGLDVLESEYLVSDEMVCASSIDKVVLNEEGTIDLCDVKCTSRFHNDSVAWQLSIYACLFERMNPRRKVRNLYGLWFSKGKCHKILVNRYPSDVVTLLLLRERKRIVESIKAGHYVDGDFLQVWKPEIDDVAASIADDDVLGLEVKYFQAKYIADIFKKQLEAKRNEMYDYMLSSGKKEVATSEGVYQIKLPTMVTTVDVEKLKADGLYEQYSKQSERAGSISYKLTNADYLKKALDERELAFLDIPKKESEEEIKSQF